MKPFTNPAVERGILAGISKFGKDGYLEVADLVNQSCFTVDLNQGLYNCFAHIFERDMGTSIDMHVIQSAITDLGLTHIFEKDYDYLNKVINFHVELNNLRPFAKKLRKLYEAKTLHEKHSIAQKQLTGVTGDETMSHILGLSESPILDYTNSLSSNQNEGIVPIANGIDAFIQNIKDNPGQMPGISTGFPRLDKAMGGGLRRGSVSVIAARSGIGKTFLADKIALHSAYRLKIPAIELDTEMVIHEHWPRMIAMMTHIPIDNINEARFAKNYEESKKVDRAVEILKKIPLSYVNVSGKNFEEILSIARRWVMQNVGYDSNGRTNDCLMVYDYLKLMNDEGIKDGNVKEYQALGFQITALHDFTVRYDLPCQTFVQINRDGISKDTSDVIADSDRILRIASNVFLYREKNPEEIAEDGKENGNRKMIHIKARAGGGLDRNDYINFNHNKPIGLIEEFTTRNEAHQGKVAKQKSREIELTNDELPDF